MLENIVNINLNICMGSSVTSIRLKLLDLVFKVFLKVLSCAFKMLFVAFFFYMGKLWVVKIKVFRIFCLLVGLKRDFYRLSI